MGENKSRIFLAISFAVGMCIASSTGCQSWQGGYPLSNPARVPPPGTGTYQVPSGYYNNTGGQVSQMNPVGGYTNGMPSTNLTVSSSAPVQTAGFAGNPSYGQGVVPAASFGPAQSGNLPSTNGNTVNFSDGSNVPALNWQN